MLFANTSFAISTFRPASSWCTILISHAFLPATEERYFREARNQIRSFAHFVQKSTYREMKGNPTSIINCGSTVNCIKFTYYYMKRGMQKNSKHVWQIRMAWICTITFHSRQLPKMSGKEHKKKMHFVHSDNLNDRPQFPVPICRNLFLLCGEGGR